MGMNRSFIILFRESAASNLAFAQNYRHDGDPWVFKSFSSRIETARSLSKFSTIGFFISNTLLFPDAVDPNTDAIKTSPFIKQTQHDGPESFSVSRKFISDGEK